MRHYLNKFLPFLGCAFFFSLFINILQLSYILYVRLLFDKVMISQSMPTLFYLTLGVIGAFMVMGLLEVIRSKLLVRVGVGLDQTLGERVFDGMIAQASRQGAAVHAQGLKDVNTIRSFMGGAGIFAVFDTPWVPVYLAIVFLFHPWLGSVAVGGAILLLLLVVAQEVTTAKSAREQSESSISTQQFLSSTMRNAQVVHAMGMLPALTGRWKQMSLVDTARESEQAGKEGFFQSMAKMMMMSVSLIIMAIGGYLVIHHEITIGTMIAASMIMGKALSPILMLGTAWKQLVQSRLSWGRLNEILLAVKQPSQPAAPASGKLGSDPNFLSASDGVVPDGDAQPEPLLQAENITYSISDRPVLRNVSLVVSPGEVLAIAGPSGAGKSTLARIITGLWPPERGRLVLPSGAIGYVPQEVDLFSATIADNIARMGAADDREVVRSAKAADAHEMILQFPKGYDTPVGRGGVPLSGGQKQRVALARALYGSPSLLVLDEPDSHLDNNGRAALISTLEQQKKQGVGVILISHNPSLQKLADRVLELHEGTIKKEVS